MYVAVPLKKTWEVDLVKPLRSFIAETYGGGGPCSSPGDGDDDHSAALTEFNRLRNNAIAKSVDKHDSALEVLYRYYDQLAAVEGKFPISENQIRISFKWQDAFDKESLFSGKRTLAIASSSYERVCLLFNIAALQSQVGQSQNLTSDDGLKTAAKLFQLSSGIFAHLHPIVLSSVQADPTPDLHPDTLSALSALMLAQGQDCFARKAMNDKMKPAIVAKLSYQCSEFYAEALKLLQLETLKSLWPKDWITSVAGKQAAFHGIAEYYQSLVSKEAKDFGDEIARLRHSKDLLGAAETKGGTTFSFQDVQKKVVRGLQEAEKDNDFIYHSRIPEISALPSIGKAAVAKTLPFTPPLSSQFKDLFEKVVPLAVHQAMTSFGNRKAEIVNMEIGRLREATQLLNSILVSLNLPAALEDLSGTQLPKSVREKSAKMREMGGYDSIARLMNDLPSLLQRNKEILDEAEKLLDEEAQSDEQLRNQFKERWTRTPSERLTEPIRSELTKYRTIIENAIRADAVVREKFNAHREGMELLSKPDSEIEQALPSAGATGSLENLPAVGELKNLMREVGNVKQERDELETQLKDADCSDMTVKFMSALSRDGAINEEALSAEQLDVIFSPLRENVSTNIRRQEGTLEKIQSVNLEFSEAKAKDQSGVSRDEKLKSLASAYDIFMELKGNVEEGTAFYNNLTQLLVKFQCKVSDFCFARRTEKDELMKDLSASIARQSTPQHPATPAYQQGPAAQPTPAMAPASQAAYNPPGSYPTGIHPPPNPAMMPGQQPTPYPTAYNTMPMPTSYNPYMNWGGSPQQYQPPVGYGQPQARPQYPPYQPPQYPQQYPPPQYPQQYPPQQYPPQQYPQYPGSYQPR